MYIESARRDLQYDVKILVKKDQVNTFSLITSNFFNSKKKTIFNTLIFTPSWRSRQVYSKYIYFVGDLVR